MSTTYTILPKEITEGKTHKEIYEMYDNGELDDNVPMLVVGKTHELTEAGYVLKDLLSLDTPVYAFDNQSEPLTFKELLKQYDETQSYRNKW